MTIIIQLQNLQWSATSADVRKLFRGLFIPEGGVHIIGGEKGKAFVAFETESDAHQALRKNGFKVKSTRISLQPSSQSELDRAIAEIRDNDATVRKQFSPPFPLKDGSQQDKSLMKQFEGSPVNSNSAWDEAYEPMWDRKEFQKNWQVTDMHSLSPRYTENERMGSCTDYFENVNEHISSYTDCSENVIDSGNMKNQNVRRDFHYRNQRPEVKFVDSPNLYDRSSPTLLRLLEMSGSVQCEDSEHSFSRQNDSKDHQANMRIGHPIEKERTSESFNNEQAPTFISSFPDDDFLYTNTSTKFLSKAPRFEISQNESILNQPTFQNRMYDDDMPMYRQTLPGARGEMLPDSNQKLPTNLGIQISGLPPHVSLKDIQSLIKGVFLPQHNMRYDRDRDHKKSGTVYVRLSNHDDYIKALHMKNLKFENVPVSITACPNRIFFSCFGYQLANVGGKRSLNKVREKGFCFMLRGLPYSAVEEDILNFFSGLNFKDLLIVYDDKRQATGTGFVQFENKVDYQRAYEKNGKKIGYRYIEMLKCSTDDIKDARSSATFTSRPIGEILNLQMFQNRNTLLHKRPLCAVLSGLPFTVTTSDIYAFFNECGIQPSAVHNILNDNHTPSGRAFIEFNDLFDLDIALKQQGKYIGENMVANKQVLFDEMLKILESYPAQHDFSAVRKQLASNSDGLLPEKLPYIWEPPEDIIEPNRYNYQTYNTKDLVMAGFRRCDTPVSERNKKTISQGINNQGMTSSTFRKMSSFYDSIPNVDSYRLPQHDNSYRNSSGTMMQENVGWKTLYQSEVLPQRIHLTSDKEQINHWISRSPSFLEERESNSLNKSAMYNKLQNTGMQKTNIAEINPRNISNVSVGQEYPVTQHYQHQDIQQLSWHHENPSGSFSSDFKSVERSDKFEQPGIDLNTPTRKRRRRKRNRDKSNTTAMVETHAICKGGVVDNRVPVKFDVKCRQSLAANEKVKETFNNKEEKLALKKLPPERPALKSNFYSVKLKSVNNEKVNIMKGKNLANIPGMKTDLVTVGGTSKEKDDKKTITNMKSNDTKNFGAKSNTLHSKGANIGDTKGKVFKDTNNNAVIAGNKIPKTVTAVAKEVTQCAGEKTNVSSNLSIKVKVSNVISRTPGPTGKSAQNVPAQIVDKKNKVSSNNSASIKKNDILKNERTTNSNVPTIKGNNCDKKIPDAKKDDSNKNTVPAEEKNVGSSDSAMKMKTGVVAPKQESITQKPIFTSEKGKTAEAGSSNKNPTSSTQKGNRKNIKKAIGPKGYEPLKRAAGKYARRDERERFRRGILEWTDRNMQEMSERHIDFRDDIYGLDSRRAMKRSPSRTSMDDFDYYHHKRLKYDDRECFDADMRGYSPPPSEYRDLSPVSYNPESRIVHATYVSPHIGLEDIFHFFREFRLSSDDVIRRYTEYGDITGDVRIAFESPSEARRAVDYLDGCNLAGSQVMLTLV